MKSTLSSFIGTIVLAMFSCQVTQGGVVSFGSGSNQFSIDFVSIGNPGNPVDTTGNPGAPNYVGSVAYTYNMGKYEVSRDMITKANAQGLLGISLEDLTPYGGNGVNRPATGVNWNEAARFVNWLNTSQGYHAAYKYDVQPGNAGYSANADIGLWTPSDPGYNAANPFRNDQAHYFLPSNDEWYKAAYYDPVTGNYYDYATGSDTAPTPVTSGTGTGSAVYKLALGVGPSDITQAGGLSPYGTMAQGGNLFEWQETEKDLVNDTPSAERDIRGGCWFNNGSLSSTTLIANSPSTDIFINVGFRVASVPELNTLTLSALGIGGLLLWRARYKRT